MSRDEHNLIGYVVALVSEFGIKYHIMPRQAYAYLKRYKGLDHLYKHFSVLHTQSFEDSVEVMYDVCKAHGGQLSL